MNAQYLNPFLAASFSVLEMLLGKPPVRGQAAMQASSFSSDECSVICGITGQAHGQIIFGMSRATACGIAGAMLGSPVTELDILAASAIAELGNMISGGSMQRLSEAGLTCDITPPSLLEGNNIYINTLGIPAITVPLTTDYGTLHITISLQPRK
jgi:chemotaxis protein CheX